MPRSPLLLVLLAACGDTFENQEACEAFVRSQSCGSTDFSTLLDCSVFAAQVTCDLQPYFDCLGEHGACDTTTDPATFDDAGWATCRELAVCTAQTDDDDLDSDVPADSDAGSDTDTDAG